MTNTQDHRIKKLLSNLVFSDNSTVKSRSSDIIKKGSNIGFSLDISDITLEEANSLRDITVKELKKLTNFEKVSIVLTSNNNTQKEQKNEKTKIHIDNVKKLILIAAGKGGVGKSTISALLAHKLTADGKKVGIIDADIYGPSIPNIFALKGKPKLEDSKMIPLKNYGIAINSIGFLTEPGISVTWRGPMISKALYQLLSLTKWDNLDYLIVDTPPGTGDIHLSLLQNYRIDKTYMVTTPQKVAEIDVSRAINLYKKFNIKVAGIIENMSTYTDSSTGKPINLFSGNAGKQLAAEHNIPLLAQIPITPELSLACDKGLALNSYSQLIKDVNLV